jgi:hypothetical protein
VADDVSDLRKVITDFSTFLGILPEESQRAAAPNVA